MLKVAICDDETKICEIYRKSIEKHFMEAQLTAEIQTFDSAEGFLKELLTETFNLVFLDIDMPAMTGLEIAERMNSLEYKPLLVFVTNHDALVFQSFDYHPFGFIRKSYFDDEITKVLQNAINQLLHEKYTYTFRYGSDMVRLALSDILYFESAQNYLILYTSDSSFRYRETLIAVETELAGKGFLRIHKGFFINQEAVYKLGTDDVTLTNGVTVPIGRTNKDTVKQKLMRYLMR